MYLYLKVYLCKCTACTGVPTLIPDWPQFGTSCYKNYMRPATFPQAKANCEAVGAMLVKIATAAEEDFVFLL